MNTPTRIQIESFSLSEGKGPSFNMITIPGGSHNFQKKVKIDIPPFQLGQYLVSQELWQAVTGENPSRFIGPGRPVDTISWYNVVEFCNQLSERLNLEPAYSIDKAQKDPNNDRKTDQLKWTVSIKEASNGFRLPFEAEWEYGASGGPYSRQSQYAGSQDLNQVGWYGANSQKQSHAPSLKAPNELGLYDISGGLREWCWDWRSKEFIYISEVPNPIYGPRSGRHRMLRGGAWLDVSDDCRVSDRLYYFFPGDHHNFLGLRLARTLTL